jgi:23S rRNA G2445 N2-methylase RlmL
MPTDGPMAQFLAKPQRFIIRPAPGWSKLTITEVCQILGHPLQSYKFKPAATLEDGLVVVSECDFRQAMELAMRVTTAHDMDWILASSRVSGWSEWSSFIAKSHLLELWTKPQAVHVAVSVSHPVVGTEKEVKRLFSKALLQGGHEVLADFSGRGNQLLAQRLRVECQKNRTRLLVSLGGEPLYKRGYKALIGGATAPLPEHLAAACARWTLSHLGDAVRSQLQSGARTLVVPFAGTGTTGLEMVCQLADMAPGVTRQSYGFESWSFSPQATLRSIRKRLVAQIKPISVHLRWGDINAEVVAALHEHVEAFCAAVHGRDDDSHQRIIQSQMSQNDFLSDPQALCLGSETVFLPLNPPYGQRLAKESGSRQIYKRLGLALARLAQNIDVAGYVICPDETSWVTLSETFEGSQQKTCHFSHGGQDMRLLSFAAHGG